MVSKDRQTSTNNLPDLDRDKPGQGKGFLGRWSQRKLDADKYAGDGAPGLPAQEQGIEDSKTEELDTRTDADMPSIESLDENSDYSGFMAPMVSEKLRQLALRKLFRLPMFNIIDGLDDYAEDYTTFEALGNIVTADMKYEMEVKELKKKLLEEQNARVANQDTEALSEEQKSEQLPQGEEEEEIVETAEEDQGRIQQDAVATDELIPENIDETRKV